RRRRREYPAVVPGARDDVQVHVEDGLECGLAVAQQEVDPVGRDARAAHGACHAMCERPDALTDGAVEILETDAVRPRNHQQVARRRGVQIHEGHGVLVLVDDAGLGAAGGDLAEQARVLGHGAMLAGCPGVRQAPRATRRRRSEERRVGEESRSRESETAYATDKGTVTWA